MGHFQAALGKIIIRPCDPTLYIVLADCVHGEKGNVMASGGIYSLVNMHCIPLQQCHACWQLHVPSTACKLIMQANLTLQACKLALSISFQYKQTWHACGMLAGMRKAFLKTLQACKQVTSL